MCAEHRTGETARPVSPAASQGPAESSTTATADPAPRHNGPAEGGKANNGTWLAFPSAPANETFFQKYYYQIVTAMEVLVDYLAVYAAFLIAKGLHSLLGQDPPLAPMDWTMALHVAGACALVICVYAVMGLYRKNLSLLNIDELRRLFRAVLVIAVIVFTVSFYIQAFYSRLTITLWLLLVLSFTIIVKMIFFKIHQALHLRGLNIRRVLIYGAGEIGRKLYKHILTFPKLGFRAVGFIDDDPEAYSAELQRVDVAGSNMPRILGTPGDLERIVRDYGVDELIIAHKGMSSDDILKVTTKCKELGIQFKIIPQIYGYFIENLTLQQIGGIPLIGERVRPIRRFDLFVKRILDLTIATLVCIFFAPVFAILAILIKGDSPGPIIFRQKRVGKKGKEFTIFKFRTMYVDAPSYSYCPRESSDPRITKIGRYLRKTSFDELPQFFNVLRGEMSVVGPRPEMPFIVQQYNPLHRERLEVKPGITGLWQISADRQLEIHENMDYDLYYMQNFSILLDVAIIVRTALQGLLAMKTA
jgi:exopolysaccharide biosynthesis polyprenyl glycosylphosphotransferase